MYRISADSVLKGPVSEDSSEQAGADDKTSDTADMIQPEVSMEVQTEEAVPESLYAGLIIKN